VVRHLPGERINGFVLKSAGLNIGPIGTLASNFHKISLLNARLKNREIHAHCSGNIEKRKNTLEAKTTSFSEPHWRPEGPVRSRLNSMSEHVSIPVDLLRDERLSLSDVRVYATLRQKAGDEHTCSISREDLSRESTVIRVSRHTRKLADCGYISIGKSGEGNKNTYNFPEGKDEMKEHTELKLTEFAAEYLEYSSGVHTKKTRKTYETAFRELIRIGGDCLLEKVGIREVERFLSVKKSEASEWSSRKYYIALRSAFQTAVHWELIKENPFSKVKSPKPAERIPAFFQENDFAILLSAIDDKDFRDLCVTGILTGLRLGELLNLRWKDINFSRKAILIQNTETFTTKNKHPRIVSMSEDVSGILAGRKENIRIETEIVFHDRKGRPLKEGTVSQKFKRYVRRTGLDERLHFHSLRHSFASGLVATGASLYQVQKLLGHSTSKTTEKYSHLLPQQLHKEVNALAEKFSIRKEGGN
jgi:site-specific recombinase XerD